MILFWEYNFDTGEIIRYNRHGECCHCGECCTTRIDFHGIGHKGRGTWACVVEEGKDQFWQQVSRVGETGAEVCQHFVNGRCDIHDTKVRMCKLWPMTPAQAALFPGCSYTFTVAARGEL